MTLYQDTEYIFMTGDGKIILYKIDGDSSGEKSFVRTGKHSRCKLTTIEEMNEMAPLKFIGKLE